MQLDLPYLLRAGYHARGRHAVFELADRAVSIQAPAALLAALRGFIEPLSPRKWIAQRAAEGWDADNVTPLLGSLAAEGVLIPARDLPRHLWAHAHNPRRHGETPGGAALAGLLSDAQAALAPATRPDDIALASPLAGQALARLIAGRRSHRRFGGEALSAATLSALAWAAAGTLADPDGTRRGTTPSAGALYPLSLYLLNLRAVPELAAGAYLVMGTGTHEMRLRPLNAEIEPLQVAFAQPDLLDHAQAVFVICGDFSRSEQKYGSRALAYVPLEAGHAAQNLLLMAEAQACAAVEVGGFVEEALARLLTLPEDHVPLTTVVAGSAAPALPAPAAGSPAQFEWVHPPHHLTPSLYLCRARQAPDEPWSWGRGRQAGRARMKAEMESQERAALHRPRGLLRGRADEIEGAIAPDRLLPYAASQYRHGGIAYSRWDPERVWLWQPAHDVFSGTPCAVLADLVYMETALDPLRHDGPARYTAANTSGVASHDSLEQAIESATLELIERDAFMHYWLQAPQHARGIDEHALPPVLRTRLATLRSMGLHIVLRDISRRHAAVAFCYAQSARSHYTRVATAAHYDLHAALDHALEELEAQIVVTESITNETSVRLTPDAVRDADDHARLYAQRRDFRSADHLAAPCAAGGPPQQGPADWPSLQASLQAANMTLIAVDLSANTPALTPTARVFIPELVPLKFGAGNQPQAHPALVPLLRADALARRRIRHPHPLN